MDEETLKQAACQSFAQLRGTDPSSLDVEFRKQLPEGSGVARESRELIRLGEVLDFAVYVLRGALAGGALIVLLAFPQSADPARGDQVIVPPHDVAVQIAHSLKEGKYIYDSSYDTNPDREKYYIIDEWALKNPDSIPKWTEAPESHKHHIIETGAAHLLAVSGFRIEGEPRDRLASDS